MLMDLSDLRAYEYECSLLYIFLLYFNVDQQPLP